MDLLTRLITQNLLLASSPCQWVCGSWFSSETCTFINQLPSECNRTLPGRIVCSVSPLRVNLPLLFSGHLFLVAFVPSLRRCLSRLCCPWTHWALTLTPALSTSVLQMLRPPVWATVLRLSPIPALSSHYWLLKHYLLTYLHYQVWTLRILTRALPSHHCDTVTLPPSLTR